MALLFNSVSQYSSDIYEVARNVLASRNRQAARSDNLKAKAEASALQVKRLARKLRATELALAQSQEELRSQQQANESTDQPIQLPIDLPLKYHTFGPKLISLCLNLANQIGFRPAATALKTILVWLGIQEKLPTWSTIRNWSMRVGVSIVKQNIEKDDWIWIADHSNQIGQEQVLLIIGICASNLPAAGQTLSLKDMHVLAVVPGRSWKREDVRREYKKLAKQIGAPRFLVTDGAVELRESADIFENTGKPFTLLRDLKHVAANVFEKLIGNSPEFKDFISRVGKTRNAIQQTELSHFVPPPQKAKSRFMNLGPLLRWAQMVSYHLSNSHSDARKNITAERMNEKLGWLRKFRSHLESWQRCQQVMQTSLKFINEQGLSIGHCERLKALLDAEASQHEQPCQLSQSMATKLIEFVAESEVGLRAGERAWLSTENIESAFGQYKRLEGQHSKGGFTTLVAAMPTLLYDWTPELVRKHLSQTSVKDMKRWLNDNLAHTLTAKRTAAYQEAKGGITP